MHPTPLTANVHRNLSRLLAIGLLLLAATPASAARRIALCIGINEYGAAESLKYAVRDATAMGAELRRRGFDEVATIHDAQASRERILAELARLSAAVAPGDTVVIFFAGHARRVTAAAVVETYLVPHGCAHGAETTGGLSIRALAEQAAGFVGAKVLLLLDACHSGDEFAMPVRDLDTTAAALEILTAGSELELAFEQAGHGLFTRAILNALVTADGAAPPVTGAALAQSVAAAVTRATGGWQRPHFRAFGVSAGDVLL